MNPVEPRREGHRVVYGVGQPQYRPLPAVLTAEGCWTSWELTLEERRAILDGARVELFIMTFDSPLQPVRLCIEGIEEPVVTG